jgi:hypothetical protein
MENMSPSEACRSLAKHGVLDREQINSLKNGSAPIRGDQEEVLWLASIAWPSQYPKPVPKES